MLARGLALGRLCLFLGQIGLPLSGGVGDTFERRDRSPERVDDMLREVTLGLEETDARVLTQQFLIKHQRLSTQ